MGRSKEAPQRFVNIIEQTLSLEQFLATSQEIDNRARLFDRCHTPIVDCPAAAALGQCGLIRLLPAPLIGAS
jgi:hypothetical protein